jgi:3-hydroxyisobutyrate dehydrogenase-like beta-hydroxyacid dehydrogenase
VAGSVAFVGTGTMGAPMATRLLGAGFDVRVHDAAASATTSLVTDGATAWPSPARAAAGARLVMLSLPGPQEVEAVVVGPDGVLTAEPVPRYVVDLSTNAVSTVRALRARCAAAGVTFIDAPVSGGVEKARDGDLTIMVGAEPDELASVRDALDAIGSEVIHVGPSGTGAIAKLVNNQLFLGASVLVQEAFVLAAALGLAPSDVDRILAASSARPYARLTPLLLGRRFDDVVFRLDIAAKDVRLALSSADGVRVDVPLTRAASSVYDTAVAAGDGQLAFTATLRELERRAGIELPPLRRPRDGGSREAAT